MFSRGDALTYAGLTEFNSEFDPRFDDFLIKTITETAEPGEFWQLALNFRLANVGGGQLRVTTGDSVLWALVAGQNLLVPLRLNGPLYFEANKIFKVTVSDGETGKPVQGATVDGKTTDKNGQVEIASGASGNRQELRANFPGKYVRSNVLIVTTK